MSDNQPDITQRLQFAHDVFRDLFGVKKIQCLLNWHAKHIRDRLAVELIGQHFILEALAAADFAEDFHFVHKGQIGVDDAQALTIFAGTFRVETEQRRADLVGVAKALRISSMMPVYVAGLERLETPTGELDRSQWRRGAAVKRSGG